MGSLASKVKLGLAFTYSLLFYACYKFPYLLIGVIPIFAHSQLFCKFELHYHKTTFNKKIIERCPYLKA